MFLSTRSKSESETDVDSIVDDEFERNSVLGFRHRCIEKEKVWNQSSLHPEKVEDKYNVVISNDLKKVEDKLDPDYFYTTPSLTWSAGIKTNVTLELLTDIDMYLLESGIREGMCLVSKRFSKANDKNLENFDEMSPSQYIISLDVNNL
ncbi:vesicular glutamate transporter 2 [Nephila pilipes]|uniref:Vesicular glutamate transporter 2 n=1 Tax=Nephila pilipes TaxID=299642 RepID=A0A8X6U9M8_NEPPI|nr:vesicular glutamate transporter 2 [Nephila pilipes]